MCCLGMDTCIGFKAHFGGNNPKDLYMVSPELLFVFFFVKCVCCNKAMLLQLPDIHYTNTNTSNRENNINE